MMENMATDRKLIISRDRVTHDYKFFNPNDTRDKGNVIHLAAEKYKLDLSQKADWDTLHKNLGDIIGNHYMTNHDHIRPTRIVDLERPEAVVKYFNLKPLADRTWLENERKLSPEVIDSPAFIGKIFNKPFVDTKTGTTGLNTIFPIENQKGMIAIISRNTDWNMMVGGKDNGVWVSNIDMKTPPREMVIAESPLDAMAYHQLYPPKSPLERVYIATAGQPSSTQHLTIQGIINKTKPELLTLANDNEPSGIRFNILMMSRLLMPRQPVTGISTQIASSRHTNTMIVEIDHRSARAEAASIDALKDRIHQVLNRGLAEGTPKADIRTVTSRGDITQIEVDFPNQRHLLVRAENLTKEFRQTGEQVQIKRANEKDFNDDLKIDVARRQQQIQQIKDGRPERLRDEPVNLAPDWMQKLQVKLNNDRELAKKEQPVIKTGPTGLPLHRYEKGTLSNTLPKDGDRRVRKSPVKTKVAATPAGSGPTSEMKKKPAVNQKTKSTPKL